VLISECHLLRLSNSIITSLQHRLKSCVLTGRRNRWIQCWPIYRLSTQARTLELCYTGHNPGDAVTDLFKFEREDWNREDVDVFADEVCVFAIMMYLELSLDDYRKFERTMIQPRSTRL
jgi:hypothetical protein